MSTKFKHIPRVLSIQSHVVHGFVGNKCATFILQVEISILKSRSIFDIHIRFFSVVRFWSWYY